MEACILILLLELFLNGSDTNQLRVHLSPNSLLQPQLGSDAELQQLFRFLCIEQVIDYIDVKLH